VHRIGRTARAGASGEAISFCDETEAEYLRNIERLIKVRLPVDDGHDWHDPKVLTETPPPKVQRGGRPGRGGGGGGGGRGGPPRGSSGRRRR